MNLHEDGLVNIIIEQASSVPYICIHLCDKVIIADLATWMRAHRSHQVVDLIVANSDFERVEAQAELLTANESITVAVKDLEGLLKVEVLDVERRCH